ncbi:MAG TPA: lamin tail domain-containing protein, partial [Verrucomicrobiae bacterium]
QMTCYFRTRFEFNGETNGLKFVLDQVVDDGAVFYLNGKEFARSRMIGGEIKYSSPSSQNVRHTVEEVSLFAVNGALLKPGANVLAVEVHQFKTNSTDLLFAARLRAFKARPPTVMVNELFAGSAQSGFVEFFNATTEALNLKGHFLSDTAADLRKFRIARDLALAPGALAALGLAESGLSVTNPMSVYLTAPDGATALCAVSADFAGDARSLGRKPAGGPAWFRFPEPSRGLPNVTEGGGTEMRLNEVHFKEGKGVDWVEVFNPLETVASAQGLFLSARRDFSDKAPMSGALAPRGFVTANVSFPLNQGEVTLYLVNAANAVLDSRVFTQPPPGADWQAFPDGSSEWYSSSQPTRGAPNNPHRNTDVIINEIMFDPPSVLTNAPQFVELFNRGQAAMDLSGWELVEGISYTFPAGTRMPAGGYLVVTSDTNHLREAYGDVPMAGNFTGRLSHHGELIRLLDRSGNLANQVDYKTGGDWPGLAAGGGSSMELINPWMDNRLASAWRDSDETSKSVLREYSCTGKYEELHTKGGPTDYKELHFHLVGDAHVVLENIFFGKQGSGQNYILNGTKLSDDGYSAKGWLCQGNHWASTMTNGQFHLIADGHGDNRPNRAEIDVIGMNKGETCELKFKARWVSGKPRLIAQTWDHSIAGSFLLDVPRNLGTPGRPNSRFAPSPAPQVDALAHSPAVPHSTNTVRITARVSSAAPLESVQVFHRLDNEKGDGVWTNAVMRDDGLEGDAIAGDGIYSVELPPRPSGQLVQFHVLASARNGQTCALPRAAAGKPALYLVDDRPVPRDLRTARFLISQHDAGAIADGNSAKYDFKYPRHSNRYFNSTFISNEEEIFYGAEIRNSGSPWTRGGGLDRVKLKLPGDRLFRGHEHFYFDNDPAGGNFHNRVTRYWLYLMGHVVNENEIVRVVVNNSGFALREDTEPVHNDFLNRNFKHGNRGQLYRIDDEWWFTDDWDRDVRDADWGYKGSDNPGRYRTEWMKRSNEAEDDYSSLIDFFKFYSAGRYTQDEIEKRLDPRAVLPYTIVRGYIGDWDTFTMGRGKNGYFYQHPDGGPFQFLHWDSDLAFGDANSGFYGGRVAPWIEKPYNMHLFNCYLLEFHEKYAG